jgi:hypothetical protein
MFCRWRRFARAKQRTTTTTPRGAFVLVAAAAAHKLVTMMTLARQPPRSAALRALLASLVAAVLAQVPPMPDNVSSKLMIHVRTRLVRTPAFASVFVGGRETTLKRSYRTLDRPSLAFLFNGLSMAC